MDQERRTILNAVAALGATSILGTAQAQQTSDRASGPQPGMPGDFDFLAGSWRIAHRRLLPSGQWDEFPGEATCWSILGGAGSVEELRIPARDFSGMGLRLLDLENKVWVDHWVNAKGGVLSLPGTTGRFEGGAGVFISEDKDGETSVLYRGLWDQITPSSCRWSQASSRDGGHTWIDNWVMAWTRAS